MHGARRGGEVELQGLFVDLRDISWVTWVHLHIDADADADAGVPAWPRTVGCATGGAGRRGTSSYPLDFVVEASADRAAWATLYATASGTGGAVDLQPSRPVAARWVRMTVRRRSGPGDLGLCAFDVHGTRAAQGSRGAREPLRL